MTIPKKSDKIVIVGAGVYGLSTTLSLLESGFQDVHLFDKNDYLEQGYSYFKGCDSASSDMNKIFRASYGEQVHYQKLSLKSRAMFLKWNEMIKRENFENGEPLYINNGNVHLTDQKDLPPFEAETLKRMKGNDDAICVLDSDARERAVAKGLPPASVDPFGQKLQGILDTTGGTMIADKCCRWVLHLCKRVGGSRLTTHFGSKVGEVDHLLEEYNESTGGKKCVGIKTKDTQLHFASLVCVFGGSWTSQIVPEANEKLEATGGTVALIKLTDVAALEKYSVENFPTFTYKVRDGVMGGLYGFPISHGFLKIGYRGTKWINPVGKTNSKTKTAYTEDKETNVPLFGLLMIKNFIKKYIPEVNNITLTRLCWYSDTEDNDFLISYCPYYEGNSLFVGAGDSGHAFMMLGSLGDVIRSIILDKGDPFLKNLFSWSRKREKLNIINQGESDPRALCNLKMATPKDWALYPAKL